MSAAIRAENVGKRYRIVRNQASRYRTLRESLTDTMASPFRRLLGRSSAEQTKDFWALKDVSFAVEPGEVVGIVGRNGAGKSTLLKVLSRITKPTTGRVELQGRVGSLLEVGTGFHQELSGRENIFLNGSILGMTRKEIARKFDDIVGFAGVEQFLDTPVKRYSSGMYVRLAFAVAAHLEPEIMLVDEVLAVGDADFQQKCFEKMEQVAKSGRTVFLVSHQLAVVRRLCQHAIYLKDGQLNLLGNCEYVLDKYLAESTSTPAPGSWTNFPQRTYPFAPGQPTGQAQFRAARYSGDNGDHVRPNQPLVVNVQVESSIPQTATYFSVVLSDLYGTKLVAAHIHNRGLSLPLNAGLNTVTVRIPALHLNAGTYRVGLYLASSEDLFDRLIDAFQIEVVGNGEDDRYGGTVWGDGVVTCDAELECDG